MLNLSRKPMNFIQPTRIAFGPGRLSETAELAAPLGRKALLINTPAVDRLMSDQLAACLRGCADAGIEVTTFNKVQPNPRIEDVQEAAALAREKGVDFMIGMGGGSALDMARAVAVAATHPGTAMDYLYFSETQPTDATLPIMMIPTTAGTGSHTSCAAVITDEAKKFKSALWNQEQLFARVAIVDPTLTLTVPKETTAATGFDVFAHLFESYINVNRSPMVDMYCREAIAAVADTLPKLLENLDDLELRARMCYADTLAGASIANSGTTLPHAMGQPISGHCPHVSHGQSLAVVYPAFMRWTMPSAPERFADVGRLFNPELKALSDEEAARAACDEVEAFIDRIGLKLDLKKLSVPEEEMKGMIKHALEFPDCTVNPRQPTEAEVAELYRQISGR